MRYSTLISLILTALSFVAATAQQPPDTVWTRTYGGYDEDIGYCVQQTMDGGYIITGTTRSFSPNVYDVYLIKTDQNGDTVWTKTYDRMDWDDGRSVQQTADGGYIIAGFTFDLGADNSIYLIRTDMNGDTLWTRTYGGNNDEQVFCVQITSDGGFIICGNTESFGAGLYDAFLLKTDSLGNADWFRTYGGSGVDYGHFVEQTTDGGYILTGASSYYIGGYDVYLIRTDSLGNMLWERTFGGSYNDMGRCVRQTDDGGFIVAGYHKKGPSTDSIDVYLIRTNASGDSLWTRTYGGNYWDEGYSVDLTLDGGCIVSGFSEIAPNGNNDFILIKTDALGNEIWSSTFGGLSGETGRFVRQTTDGGFIVCGSTGSYGAGGVDVWLIKVEAEYLVVTLNPINHPIIIPSNGGNFSFDATVENATGDPFGFDSWTIVVLPNGNTFGPVISRNGLTIQAGMMLTRQITQIVPGNAPAGNYIYIGNVGAYPDIIWCSDRFPFMKRP